ANSSWIDNPLDPATKAEALKSVRDDVRGRAKVGICQIPADWTAESLASHPSYSSSSISIPSCSASRRRNFRNFSSSTVVVLSTLDAPARLNNLPETSARSVALSRVKSYPWHNGDQRNVASRT